MKKKEIVTLALTTALLMTAHAVPASAASNAPESMSQTGSIQTITPRWESTNVVVPSISNFNVSLSLSRLDIICPRGNNGGLNTCI